MYLNTDVTTSAQIDSIEVCNISIYAEYLQFSVVSFKVILDLKQKEKRFVLI